MNLIIASPLVDTPPSDALSIRYITSVAKCDLKMGVVIEMEQEMKDLYHPYMKRLGMMDYVDQYVTPEEDEVGVRLDIDHNFPMTIVLRRINLENTIKIIDYIKQLNGI